MQNATFTTESQFSDFSQFSYRGLMIIYIYKTFRCATQRGQYYQFGFRKMLLLLLVPIFRTFPHISRTLRLFRQYVVVSSQNAKRHKNYDEGIRKTLINYVQSEILKCYFYYSFDNPKFSVFSKFSQ